MIRKTPAPINEVMIPNGISPIISVRARSSLTMPKTAPNDMLTGMKAAAFAPAMRRAMCGMISPIQPTIPATETTTAVTATLAASSSARSRPTETPSEKAV